jgi:hypothetical protein
LGTIERKQYNNSNIREQYNELIQFMQLQLRIICNKEHERIASYRRYKTIDKKRKLLFTDDEHFDVYLGLQYYYPATQRLACGAAISVPFTLQNPFSPLQPIQ